jgi:hypothetical protein
MELDLSGRSVCFIFRIAKVNYSKLLIADISPQTSDFPTSFFGLFPLSLKKNTTPVQPFVSKLHLGV